MRAYELADITGLIKTKGLLHCPLTHKSLSSLEKCEALADGAFSVGGFQSLHDLVICGGCQAKQETCMCALRSGIYRLRKGL